MDFAVILKITLIIITSIVLIIIVFFLVKASEVKEGRLKAEKEFSRVQIKKIKNFGSIKKLTVLPIVDYYTDNKDLKTESGVSYLIKADDTTILLDTGYNGETEHPSPLLHNMEKLGIKMENIDMIFITHTHMDHMGGRKEMADKTLSLSRGNVETGNIPVYSPEWLTPSVWNPKLAVKVVRDPALLKPGIASIGPIPRFLYIVGLTHEQSLAINVRGKGIALIIGCGHQGIGKILQRTKQLLDEPIYAVIGGLHFPIKGGRIKPMNINIQYIVGTDSPPWKGLKERDIQSAIETLKKVSPSIVSLSPHDSSDWAIGEFRRAFGEKYVDLLAGKEILL